MLSVLLLAGDGWTDRRVHDGPVEIDSCSCVRREWAESGDEAGTACWLARAPGNATHDRRKQELLQSDGRVQDEPVEIDGCDHVGSKLAPANWQPASTHWDKPAGARKRACYGAQRQENLRSAAAELKSARSSSSSTANSPLLSEWLPAGTSRWPQSALEPRLTSRPPRPPRPPPPPKLPDPEYLMAAAPQSAPEFRLPSAPSRPPPPPPPMLPVPEYRLAAASQPSSPPPMLPFPPPSILAVIISAIATATTLRCPLQPAAFDYFSPACLQIA